VAPLFDDGAVFVPLEDVDGLAGFIARLCRLLGVQRLRAKDDVEALCEHLQERHLLLVLDNFEPIASMATPLIEKLLERAAISGSPSRSRDSSRSGLGRIPEP
jgi:predicted ATPase